MGFTLNQSSSFTQVVIYIALKRVDQMNKEVDGFTQVVIYIALKLASNAMCP